MAESVVEGRQVGHHTSWKSTTFSTTRDIISSHDKLASSTQLHYLRAYILRVYLLSGSLALETIEPYKAKTAAAAHSFVKIWLSSARSAWDSKMLSYLS